MKYLKWLLFFLILCPLVCIADEIPLNGDDLVEHCRVFTQIAPMPWAAKVLGPNESVATCMSYMNRAIEEFQSIHDKDNNTYCLPDEISAGELAYIYVNYSDIKPEYFEQDASKALRQVFRDAFPCR